MKIIWSATAKRNFRRVVDYLYEEWSEKEVLNFKENVRALIDKNNSLIYWFDSHSIFIVTLTDNRSSHPF